MMTDRRPVKKSSTSRSRDLTRYAHDFRPPISQERRPPRRHPHREGPYRAAFWSFPDGGNLFPQRPPKKNYSVRRCSTCFLGFVCSTPIVPKYTMTTDRDLLIDHLDHDLARYVHDFRPPVSRERRPPSRHAVERVRTGSILRQDSPPPANTRRFCRDDV